MSQTSKYTQYAVLAELEDIDAQNLQELTAIWGEIESECEAMGVDIEEVYVSLGPYDFLILLDAPSRDRVLKAALVMTRLGLNVMSMGIIPKDQFAEIVKDM